MKGQDPETESSMSAASEWVRFKDEVYFVASDGVTGACIYRTDGTAQGTKLAIQIRPGAYVPSIIRPTVVGNKLYFLADDGTDPSHSYQLYVSEGTSQSMHKFPQARIKQPNGTGNMIALNGTLFFTGSDEQHGMEVWKSDGTEAGTVMVKDIFPGTASSAIFGTLFSFTAMGNYIYFFASDGTHGFELWRTDGTDAGTTMISDINKNPAHDGLPDFYLGFAQKDNVLYFIENDGIHEDNIWKTDGTAEGTIAVTNETVAVTSLALWQGQLLFSSANKLFRTDGTPGSTLSLANVSTSIARGFDFKGAYYFLAGSELWKTDGTVVGTMKTNAATQGVYTGYGATSDLIILIAPDGGDALNLNCKMYSYDGVNPALTYVKSLRWIGAYVTGGVKLWNYEDDKIFFPYDDNRHWVEPGITDGTPEGTFMLNDINHVPFPEYIPGRLNIAGPKMFFSLADDEHGRELWVSDGTDEGTRMVKDIRAGAYGANIGEISILKDLAIFDAVDQSLQTKVWRSDGTDAGTFVISNGNIGGYTILDESIVIGDYLYYNDGLALWKTDGTANGTSKVKDIPNAGILNFGILNGNTMLFMDALDNLWKSDGTEQGTSIIKNLKFNSSYYTQALVRMQPLGNITLFVADDGLNGFQIWKTDGTSNGTSIIKTISPVNSELPYMHGVINNAVLFTASTTAEGRELWKTDGTAVGTSLVKDIRPGTARSNPGLLRNDGTNIYFTALNESNKPSIWKSDGTSQGTTMISELPNEFVAENSSQRAFYQGRLFFPASTPDTGSELWRTSFTKGSTKIVSELLSGPFSSMISSVVSLNDNLFFVGRDDSHHYKLWKVDPQFAFKDDQFIDFPAITTKKSNDPPFTLAATSTSGLTVAFEVISGPATISGNTLTLTGAGAVTVKATQAGNENYNSASAEQTFTVELFVGLEDRLTHVTIFPNPATSTILVNMPPSTYTAAVIKDMLGREMIKTNIDSEQTSIEVDNFPRGIYIMQLNGNNNRSFTTKIILK